MRPPIFLRKSEISILKQNFNKYIIQKPKHITNHTDPLSVNKVLNIPTVKTRPKSFSINREHPNQTNCENKWNQLFTSPLWPEVCNQPNTPLQTKKSKCRRGRKIKTKTVPTIQINQAMCDNHVVNRKRNNHSRPRKNKNAGCNMSLIHNLSNTHLTKNEIAVLEKGLSFCPTPRWSDWAIKKDVFKLRQKLDWKFSKGKPTKNYSPLITLLKKGGRNNREPPHNIHCLKEHTGKLLESILAYKREGKRNLSRPQRHALTQLRSRKSIIIKPSDKSGGIIILNKSDYEKEALIQLSNKDDFIEVHGREIDIIKQVNKEIETLERQLITEGALSPYLKDSLQQQKPKLANFYILPKIHKPVRPETGLPKGRPVTSGCAAPTRRLDKYLTYYLMKLLPTLPECLRDTTDFLTKLLEIKKINGPCLLYTCDIESLYPSIDTKRGIELVTDFYNDKLPWLTQLCQKEISQPPPSTQALKKGLEILMTNNYIKFGSRIFLQKRGCATGACVSVSYANIYVHSELRETNHGPHTPMIELRFIDDIFGILKGNESQLCDYIKQLQTNKGGLKFTYEYSEKEVNFLDVKVKRLVSGTIITDIYHKPTARHQFLHSNSAHPISLKRALPFSQGLRYRRIISNEEKLKARLKELKKFFVRRGYSKKMLTQELNRVLRIPRSETLKKHDKKNIDRIILTTTYHPTHENELNKQLKIFWTGIKQEYSRQYWWEHFPKQQPMIAYSRPKNLKQMLIRAAFT